MNIQIRRRTIRGASRAFTYDNLNRVTQVVQTLSNGYSVTLSYSYDANGNETALNTPWGSFSYTYDALNRLTNIRNLYSQAFTFAYDNLSRQTTLSYPNGVLTTYGYDAASQVLHVMHQRAANRSVVAYTNYSYDNDSDRLSVTNMTGPSAYGYDNLKRLTSAAYPPLTTLPIQNEVFSYDGVSNRLSDSILTSYQYNAANRLVQNSSFTYSYDANGNMTSRTSRSSGNEITFIYDSQNRIVEIDGSTGTVGTYKYDAFSKRIEKNVGGSTTHYIYDGNRVLAMLDGNNTLIALFTNGPIINETLAMRNASSSNDYFLHTDALESVIAVTDVNANVIETVEYQAYGKAVVKDASGGLHRQSTIGNPWLYTGAEYDNEIGLDHMGFREYGPEVGAFLQEDPLGPSGGSINVYAYALGNPIKLTDSFGLSIGQYPPLPPNYDPSTWTTGQWPNGKWYLQSPDGRTYTAHPEDPNHWRHWDINDSNGKDDGSWPPNNKKPRANQKKLPKDRCTTDPNGNAPGWEPPPTFIPMVPADPELPMFDIPLGIPEIPILAF